MVYLLVTVTALSSKVKGSILVRLFSIPPDFKCNWCINKLSAKVYLLTTFKCQGFPRRPYLITLQYSFLNYNTTTVLISRGFRDTRCFTCFVITKLPRNISMLLIMTLSIKTLLRSLKLRYFDSKEVNFLHNKLVRFSQRVNRNFLIELNHLLQTHKTL